MAILRIILGILVFLGGIFCAAVPSITYSFLPTFIGIVMLMEGILCFAIWIRAKRDKQDCTAILLINSILSVILGIMLLMDEQLQLSMELTIPIITAAWMVINGIFRIIDSFQIKRLGKEARRIRGKDQETKAVRAFMRELSRNWWVHLILGILEIIAGIIAFSSPFVMALSIGTWMGLEMVFIGLDMILLPDEE